MRRQLPPAADQPGRGRCELAAALTVLAVGAAGCSPALNWRDVRPTRGVVVLQLPCRPDSAERQIQLAGTPVVLQLLRCDADGLIWAFAQADVGDATRVAPALKALRDAALANMGAAKAQPLEMRVAGARQGDAVEALSFEGRLPGGDRVQVRLAVFASGTHVHQATVLGPSVPDAAAATFFDSLRVGS